MVPVAGSYPKLSAYMPYGEKDKTAGCRVRVSKSKYDAYQMWSFDLTHTGIVQGGQRLVIWVRSPIRLAVLSAFLI